MIQIVNSPSGTLRYVVPHVFSTVVDGSVVPGITTSAITGTLFTPIYTEKRSYRSSKILHWYTSSSKSYQYIWST